MGTSRNNLNACQVVQVNQLNSDQQVGSGRSSRNSVRNGRSKSVFREETFLKEKATLSKMKILVLLESFGELGKF